MSTRIKVEMKPVNTILTRLGVDKNGDVQKFVTNTINRRMTRYMPYRTGALSTKLKYVKSPTEIEVLAPYARYQYYGKAMAGPPPKEVTDKPLQYTKDFNPQAGPFWDRRMMAAEQNAIAADVMAYIRRKGK